MFNSENIEIIKCHKSLWRFDLQINKSYSLCILQKQNWIYIWKLGDIWQLENKLKIGSYNERKFVDYFQICIGDII